LLFLIPAFIFFFWMVYKKKKKALGLFISEENLSALSNIKLAALPIKALFFILGILFLILALARPQYGDKKQIVVKESSQIVVALDISKSMLAQDIKPNRLEKAKFMLLRVIEDNPGQKMGVIVFSGSAMWQCPMTYDGQALKMFLQGVESGQLPLGGTQISGAVFLAAKAVSQSPSKGKVLILISDGEDHDSKIKEALEEARKTKLKIISIGIGTRDGAPIPIKDESGAVKDYVKDSGGQIVMSRLNSALLQNVADETGGKYLDASVKDITPALIKAVKEIEKTKDETQDATAKADRFQIFLFLALIMFFIEMLITTAAKAEKTV
jgi:Ca-activated chloride channel family protein